MSIGFTVGLGGGWADQVLAHRSMLHPIPDAVPDAIASLHEPVSVAVHGLLRKPPRDGDPVLVVGAGIIGLAAVAAVRGLFPACEVTVTARHEYQGRRRRAPRARTTSCARIDNGDHFDELGRALRRDGHRPRARTDAARRLPLRDRGGRRARVGDGVDAPGRPLGDGAVHRRGRRGRGRPQRAVVQGGRARRRVEPLTRRAPDSRRAPLDRPRARSARRTAACPSRS